ncbi:carboxyltransferase domain-containing protein, partial [Bordetella pertussis]|uniref:carboxyltransferase domain-containing protein n=1 Tax=Bordetella pertussis TaxID=520 RepID=UPI0021CB5B46
PRPGRRARLRHAGGASRTPAGRRHPGRRLDLPRRATPRTAVPAGSVAIANRQTVIYPARLPGGWNIIGATPLNLFDPGREPAALLQPGDRIRFVPIDAAEFDRLREAQ